APPAPARYADPAAP
ncbi:hypothetical protein M4914_19040, partial [Streptomyces somaliensis DSM 40738]|nr:hypothetical protein [Streptomyces somaliensis DSM 40738]